MIRDNTALQQLAKAIVTDSDALTDIWDQQNYYAKHKVLRDDKELEAFDVDDLEIWEIVTRLLTLPSFISKTKKKLTAMKKGPERDELQRIIDLKTAEMEAIKNLRFKK